MIRGTEVIFCVALTAAVVSSPPSTVEARPGGGYYWGKPPAPATPKQSPAMWGHGHGGYYAGAKRSDEGVWSKKPVIAAPWVGRRNKTSRESYSRIGGSLAEYVFVVPAVLFPLLGTLLLLRRRRERGFRAQAG